MPTEEWQAQDSTANSSTLLTQFCWFAARFQDHATTGSMSLPPFPSESMTSAQSQMFVISC